MTGTPVSPSKTVTTSFIRPLQAGSSQNKWNVYIDSNTTLNEELLVSVAEVVNRIVGGLLRNSVHYLQPILRYSIYH